MKNVKGFTILELMVSIAIFSVVCVSVLELVNLSNRSNNKSDKSNIATDLASEGIEIVTYMRDNNFLNNRTYTSGILGSDRSFILVFNNINNTWTIDFGNDNNTESINSCSTSTNNSCAIYKSQSLEYYTQSRNNINSDLIKTDFYRLIEVQSYANNIKVTSTVLFKDGNENKIITLEKDLWNW